MGLFDFIAQAQEKATKRTEEIAKKLGTVPPPNITLENIFNKTEVKGEETEAPKKAKTKRPAKPKPDTSIEGISKLTLAQRDSMRKNGFKEYEFIANSGCCEVCAELNGKHFKISALKIGVNAPPMHEGCRCSIAAWEDSEEYEAWLDFISKGGTTKQWEETKRQKL
jgi:hypothetical protein